MTISCWTKSMRTDTRMSEQNHMSIQHRTKYNPESNPIRRRTALGPQAKQNRPIEPQARRSLNIDDYK